jgi:hypothetical protein
MAERNSQTFGGPGQMQQPGQVAPYGGNDPYFSPNIPAQPGGGGMDFASFMQGPQGQALMQQIMQRKMAGGGMYAGGSPGFRENNPMAQPTGNAPFPMHPQQPLVPPPNLGRVPGPGMPAPPGGLLGGARGMVAPQGLPPGVSMGLQPGALANRQQRGLY